MGQEEKEPNPSLIGVLLQAVTLGMKRVSPSRIPELVALLIVGVIAVLLPPSWARVPYSSTGGILAVIALVTVLAILFRLPRRLENWVVSTIVLTLVLVFAMVAVAATIGAMHAGTSVKVVPATTSGATTIAVRAVTVDATTGSELPVRTGSVVLVAGADYANTEAFDRVTGIARFTNVPADALRDEVRIIPDVPGYTQEAQIRRKSVDLITIQLEPIAPSTKASFPAPPTETKSDSGFASVKPISIPSASTDASSSHGSVEIQGYEAIAHATLTVNDSVVSIPLGAQRIIAGIGTATIALELEGCRWTQRVDVRAGQISRVRLPKSQTALCAAR